jgi:hypothetical protein
MYPGTYQPLQAVSLLLADLLQHPHNDDANLSRGLVDAIFDLYQADEGVVSQNDPPKRQLSPSGREAWLMLARTRQQALQQVGLDHHVLFPSNAVFTSNRCICGEKISIDGHDSAAHTQVTHQTGVSIDRGDTAPVASGGGMASQLPDADIDNDAEEAGGLLYDQADFDWHAWDSVIGPSGGLMP